MFSNLSNKEARKRKEEKRKEVKEERVYVLCPSGSYRG
jgi:hypothetical protein